jgi:hypothetical protein
VLWGWEDRRSLYLGYHPGEHGRQASETNKKTSETSEKVHVTEIPFPQLLPAPIPIHQNQFLRRSLPSFYLSQTIYHVANSRCALVKQHARKTSRKCMIYCNCTLPASLRRLPLHSAKAAKAIDTSQMSVDGLLLASRSRGFILVLPSTPSPAFHSSRD